MPVHSRNWHDVVFRVVEIGVAVWFPAVLWNCMSPSELWILNPKKLLRKVDAMPPGSRRQVGGEQPLADGEMARHPRHECWICYDSDGADELIRPCACTGDVSRVHHECLRRWLLESSSCSNQVSLVLGFDEGKGRAIFCFCVFLGVALQGLQLSV